MFGMEKMHLFQSEGWAWNWPKIWFLEKTGQIGIFLAELIKTWKLFCSEKNSWVGPTNHGRFIIPLKNISNIWQDFSFLYLMLRYFKKYYAILWVTIGLGLRYSETSNNGIKKILYAVFPHIASSLEYFPHPI